MADIGNFFNTVGSGIWTTVNAVWLWVIIFGGVVVALTFVFLIWNRNKKLMYPVEEILYFGNGKIGINRLRAGRFSRNMAFFGLVEMPGEKVMRTNDGRIIQYGSLEDCHMIQTTPGFIVKRKDDDALILLPISKAEITNMKLILEIAPGDYRDVASRLLQEKETEMKAGWQKVIEQVMPFIVMAVALIAIIMIINFASNQLEEARAFYKEVFDKVPRTANAAPPSTAP